MLCEDFVRGDYRSPNGANRIAAECLSPAKFAVTSPGRANILDTFYVCGRHVRAFRRHNRVMREEIYQIEALPRSVTKRRDR